MLNHSEASEETPTSLLPGLNLLTLDQVATLLQVSRGTVYRLINSEGLPYIQVKAGHKRFTLSSIQWWINRQERSNNPLVDDDLQQRFKALSEPPQAMPARKTGKQVSAPHTRRK